MNKQNKVLLIEWLPRTCTWHGPKGFVNSKDAKRGMQTSMVEVSIAELESSPWWKEFSSGDDEDACICKKLSGSAEYILLIGNDVSFIDKG